MTRFEDWGDNPLDRLSAVPGRAFAAPEEYGTVAYGTSGIELGPNGFRTRSINVNALFAPYLGLETRVMITFSDYMADAIEHEGVLEVVAGDVCYDRYPLRCWFDPHVGSEAHVSIRRRIPEDTLGLVCVHLYGSSYATYSGHRPYNERIWLAKELEARRIVPPNSVWSTVDVYVASAHQWGQERVRLRTVERTVEFDDGMSGKGWRPLKTLVQPMASLLSPMSLTFRRAEMLG